MTELWDKIKTLFSAAEQSSPNQPLIHEVIQRSELEKEDYEKWKGKMVCKQLREWLGLQYSIFQSVPKDTQDTLDFLNSTSSKGFVIYFNKMRYSKRDAVYFLDFLKEVVQSCNYRVQLSDLKTYNQSTWVETVQRHYLKPRSSFEIGKKSDQGYGNIMIELFFRNDEVYQLRFRATVYQDHLYNQAENFEQLMDKITC